MTNSRCFSTLSAATAFSALMNGKIQTFSLPRANGKGSREMTQYFVTW